MIYELWICYYLVGIGTDDYQWSEEPMYATVYDSLDNLKKRWEASVAENRIFGWRTDVIDADLSCVGYPDENPINPPFMYVQLPPRSPA